MLRVSCLLVCPVVSVDIIYILFWHFVATIFRKSIRPQQWFSYYVFFNFAFALEPRTAWCFSLERFSSAQDISMLVSFPSLSSSLCLMSGLSILALFIFFPLKFFGIPSTSPSPFRTGSYEKPDFFGIAVFFVFRLTSFWSGTSSRSSPAALNCFVPRFSLYPIDFLSSHALVPGLLQTALGDFHRIHAHILLFPEIYFFVFTFYLVRHFLSFLRSDSFVLWFSALCFDLPQTIGCEWSSMPALCLANVFHGISMPRFWFAYVMPVFFPFKMSFWSRLMGKYRLARPQRVGFPQYSLGKRFFMRAGVLNCNGAAGKRRKHQQTSGKHNGGASDNCFFQRNFAKITSR